MEVTMIRLAAWVFLVMALSPPARPQEAGADDLEAGQLLVADDELKDPPFAQTVILLIHYGDEGTVGLIVNRPSKTPLSEVFPAQSKAKNHSDPVYEGGPVDETGVLGLLRSATGLDDAGLVFAHVYVTTSKDLLAKSAAGQKGPASFRAYLGYCGWAPGQLEMETEAGAWHVMDADEKLVFDGAPETLWRRLFEKTGLRMAKRTGRSRSNPTVGFIPGDFGGLHAKIQKNAPAVRPMRQALGGVGEIGWGYREAGLPEGAESAEHVIVAREQHPYAGLIL